MIPPKHVIISHIIFEKINLNNTSNFFDDIKNIDLNLITINKKYVKNTDAASYKIKYITMQSINNQNIDKEVPLFLNFSDVDAYIIEENENKYLVFVLTKNNKEVLELYKKLTIKKLKNELR